MTDRQRGPTAAGAGRQGHAAHSGGDPRQAPPSGRPQRAPFLSCLRLAAAATTRTAPKGNLAA